MNQSHPEHINKNSGEITIGDLLTKIRSAIKYIRSKWIIISIIAILGAALGFGYSSLKKPRYTAICTFVLEDAKNSGGMGQYSGLASIAGINIGGSGGGIFEGDNILELYKSRSMIEKALLSDCDFGEKKELLIDRFIDHNGLREKWQTNSQLNHINFKGNPDNFSRVQDSIVSNLTDLFNKDILNVDKPDKKLNIIYVEVTTKDELFSKVFTEKLVQNVNDFYIQTKTKKAYQNVKILQRQADSVKEILNSSINGVAFANDAAPNANPEMSTLRVSSQKRQVDVQANTAIYSEMVKNLELEKINLRQEMPLIQVIDKPVLPLKINQIAKPIAIIFGAIISAIAFICLLLIRKFLNSVLE